MDASSIAVHDLDSYGVHTFSPKEMDPADITTRIRLGLDKNSIKRVSFVERLLETIQQISRS
jgi:hypothetical protein